MRRRLLLSLLATCLAVASVDMLARLWINSPVYQKPWPEIPRLSRFAPDTFEDTVVIGDLAAMTPDHAGSEPREVQTRIDSFGFRNDPGAAEAPVDVIVLGDSFGFGGGTTQHKTFASLLHERYGRAVYNLSLPFTGPWAEFANLTLEAPRLKLRNGATVIWVIFSGNDLDDYYGALDIDRIPRSGSLQRAGFQLLLIRNRSPVYQTLRWVRNAFSGAVPTAALPSVFIDGRTLWFVKPYVEARNRTFDDVVHHPNYQALRRTIAAGRLLADKMHVRLKLVLIPPKEEVYGWVLDKGEPWSTPAAQSGFALALREIADDAGLQLLNLTPTLIAESRALYERSGKLLWWYDDTHWNEEGHALAASVIDRELLSH
jgi:hypothetical protein